MSAGVFGRDAELQALAAFLDGLPTGPAAVVLAGAAGAGKTTLIRAGAALAADHGITVLRTAPAVGELDEAAKVAAGLGRSAREPTTAAVAARPGQKT